MEIILYNSKAEPIRVNKENYLTNALTLRGSLRESCSVITPSILIQLTDNFNYVIIENPYNEVIDEQNSLIFTGEEISKKYLYTFNYVYIPDFKRYYYVNDIISVASGLWRIELNVDVLMSYKREFLDIECLIGRQEFDYDGDLKDDLLPFKSNQLEFQGESSYRTPFFTNSYDTTYEEYYCNNIIHTWRDSGTKFYPSPDTMFPFVIVVTSNWLGQVFGKPISKTFDNNSGYSIPYFMEYYMFNNMLSKLFDYDGTEQYFQKISDGVQAIMAFPFDIKSVCKCEKEFDGYFEKIPYQDFYNLSEYNTTSLSKIYIGTKEYDLPTVQVDTQTKQSSGIIGIFDKKQNVKVKLKIDIPNNDILNNLGINYINFNPFTRLEIFIPFLGYVNINPDICMGKTVECIYYISFIDGYATVELKCGDVVLLTDKCMVAHNYPISSSDVNTKEWVRALQVTNAGVNLATQTLGSFPNPLRMVTNATKGVTDIGLSLVNNKDNFSTSKGNSNLIYNLGLNLKYKITQYNPIAYDKGEEYMKEYRHQNGSPLFQYRKMSELNGFTVVNSIHLDNISGITSGEMTTLEDILTNGVIL